MHIPIRRSIVLEPPSEHGWALQLGSLFPHDPLASLSLVDMQMNDIVTKAEGEVAVAAALCTGVPNEGC
jgi:hypothetical protein